MTCELGNLFLPCAKIGHAGGTVQIFDPVERGLGVSRYWHGLWDAGQPGGRVRATGVWDKLLGSGCEVISSSRKGSDDPLDLEVYQGDGDGWDGLVSEGNEVLKGK